jgi:type II secretory pathway component PulF
MFSIILFSLSVSDIYLLILFSTFAYFVTLWEIAMLRDLRRHILSHILCFLSVVRGKIYTYIKYYNFFMSKQPLADQGVLIVDALRSQTTTDSRSTLDE